jgi:hypothetical protein
MPLLVQPLLLLLVLVLLPAPDLHKGPLYGAAWLRAVYHCATAAAEPSPSAPHALMRLLYQQGAAVSAREQGEPRMWQFKTASKFRESAACDQAGSSRV